MQNVAKWLVGGGERFSMSGEIVPGAAFGLIVGLFFGIVIGDYLLPNLTGSTPFGDDYKRIKVFNSYAEKVVQVEGGPAHVSAICLNNCC